MPVSAKSPGSGRSVASLNDAVKMLPQLGFHVSLAADSVVVKDDAVASDVEGQLSTPLRQENRLLRPRVGITQLVEHVGIWWRDLGDDAFGLLDPADDVL